ncbi:MAG: SGNH/GDSL hydrolase family protein [Candidatus Margulisiibacteriota bacterium]
MHKKILLGVVLVLSLFSFIALGCFDLSVNDAVTTTTIAQDAAGNTTSSTTSTTTSASSSSTTTAVPSSTTASTATTTTTNTTATTTTTTTTTLAAPTGAVATGGNSEITISWNAVSGATSYNLYWKTSNGVTILNGTKISGAARPYTHLDRTNGTAYYYIITAVKNATESAASSQVSATPSAPVAVSKYVAMGASFTTGYAGVEGDRYYNKLLAAIKAIYPLATGSNLASNGAPMDMIRALELADAVAANPSIVTVWPEGNDIINNRNTAAVNTDNFSSNLDLVLAGLAATDAKIIVGKIPDITKMPCMSLNGQTWQGWNDTQKTNARNWTTALNTVITNLATTYDCSVVDFYGDNDLYAAGNYIADDGLHFSDTGHTFVKNKWWSVIQPLIQ